MRFGRFVAGAIAAVAVSACSLLLDDGLAGTPASDEDAGGTAKDDAASASDSATVEASTTAEGGDAAAVDGVTVRGIDRAALDSSSFVRLKAPEGTQAGDVLWAVISTYYDVAVKPPPGFTTVTSTYNPGCTTAGWRIGVYVRIATASEPASYAFDYKNATFDWASGILIALAGKTTAASSAIVETSNVRDHNNNPYASAPLNAASTSSFGIVTYMREHGDSAAFSVPTGLDRLGEHGGIAVFGKQIAANTSLATASSNVTPNGCGFTHAALLNLR